MTEATIAISKPPFGKQFRKHFLFPDSFTPLNHGAFGVTPKEVSETYLNLTKEDMTIPDQFLLYLPERMKCSLKTFSKVVNTSYKNLAYVLNAASGLNIILREFPFKQGDTILITSVCFDACKNAIDHLCKRYDLKIIVVDLKFPMSNNEVLIEFEKHFQSGKIRFCFFELISSMPAIKLPFKEIVELCQIYNVVSCIDGAHSVGMLPIDLSELGCDFYVSNLHKWLYVPRGCAILYVNPRFQQFIQPIPVGSIYNDEFYKRFLVYGAANYSSYLCVESALQFVHETCGGFDHIREYCNGLRKQAILLFKSDGFTILENEEETLSSFMFNVFVKLNDQEIAYFQRALVKEGFATKLKRFMGVLLTEEFNTFIPFGWYRGSLYLRFCCQIYNQLDEFKIGYNKFLAALETFHQSDLYKQYL